MSFKEDTNLTLKLKNLHCTNCSAKFMVRDSSSKTSRCPVLLHCGHSVCEYCLKQRLKIGRSICCQECNFVSSLASGRRDDFPLSIYILGSLVFLQNHKSEKEKLLALLSKHSGNFNYSVKKQPGAKFQGDLHKNVCEECSLTALWYCDHCKSNFCDVCWAKVHGFAKSLMKHCKTSLASIDILKGGLRKCSKHEKQDLEFFCTSCSTTICSHCLILQHQGEGHCPVTLKEKNMQMLNKVKIAAEEAEVTKKRMKQTLEKINLTQSSLGSFGKELISDFEKQIIRNFFRLHGILQLQETRYLKKLHELANKREDCLKALGKQLEKQIEHVESLLAEYAKASKRPYSDLTNMHRQLEEVQNLPCYLISRISSDEKTAKITFDDKLIDSIQTYCSVDFPSSELFELCSSANLPQDYAVEPLDDSSSSQDLKSGSKTEPDSSVSDVDTLSNCSSSRTGLPKSDQDQTPKTPSQPKVFCERRNYSVRVTYIKNPGEFYVTLNSQRAKQMAIEKRAHQFTDSPLLSFSRTPCKDDIYWVKYNVDKKWYRGRVVEKSSTKIEGEECVVIYYLDYGNTEVVPLSRLKVIQEDMMEEPPLAVKCRLFDCVPKNGEWCTESTKTMEKILDNYTATMFVMKIHQDYLEVDLSVIYPEGQIGRDIVSVRDALLFLEFSSFVNGTKIPYNATAGKYLPQYLPGVGEAFESIITHVNSPSDFYIQRTKQETSYLFELTIDLQNYYEENCHKGIVYNPVVGMPCAAMFSVDNKWYRAKVIDIPGKKMVTVFYIDYGNKETLSWTKIRKLKECFVKMPPMALNCALAGIYSTDSEWSSQTRLYLDKCVMVRDCRVQVYGRVKNRQKLRVLLYKRVNNKDICVNTLFVEMGYAAEYNLNSTWPIKGRGQSETVKDGFAPQSEKINSNIDEGQPAASDTVNACHALPEPKKVKVDAKKLREQYEDEKKNKEPLATATNCENEGNVGDCDNIFKVKVEVLLAETPSSVYVTFPALKQEYLKLQMKLNEFYSDSAPCADKQWEVGNMCAVYHSRKCIWYRASVVDVLPNGDLKLFLKDVAEFITKPASCLRELDSSFMNFATCAVKCHLADIEPPGEYWPTISSEYLVNELESHREVYMTKKGQIEDKSLPIELWVNKTVLGGALEPTSKEWVTLNKLIVSQGLAVPKKSMSWYTGVASDGQKHSDAAKETPNAAPENSKPQTDAKPAEIATESPQPFVPDPTSRWPPPEPLTSTCFLGVPSYVDSDALIYVHDVEQDEEKLKMVCDSLLKEYGDSNPISEDHFWSPGQMCIARYHVDNAWYRGLVLEVNENITYDVLFVDYGNVETCQASDLRKKVKMQDVPILTHKIKIQDIEPVSEDGKWPVSVIEILHSLVVEKNCEVTILKTASDPSEVYLASLKIIADDVDVGTFFVEQGLAVTTCFSKENSNASGPEIHYLEEASSSDSAKTVDDPYLSKYKSLIISEDCKGFLVRVTALSSENEFYANIVDGDSLPPPLKSVLSEFESLEEEMTREGHAQAVIENLVKGDPCCCLNPENNKWCRGEIESIGSTENSVCVFYVDYGSKGLVDKALLHECKSEWLTLPKMALTFNLINVERCPTVSKSIYMKTLTDCLKRDVFFAEIRKEQETLAVRLLADDRETLAYQDMIDQKLMNFIQD